jgi:hypothetical protein
MRAGASFLVRSGFMLSGLVLAGCGPSPEELQKLVDARVEARLAAPPSAEQTQKQLQELKAALQADPEFAAAIAKAGTADLHAMAKCLNGPLSGFEVGAGLARGRNVDSEAEGWRIRRCAQLAMQESTQASSPAAPPAPAPAAP